MLSVLVLLVFGIIEFGRLFNAQVTLKHAAREGVRVLALTDDLAAAIAAAQGAATSLDPDAMTFTATACDPGLPVELTASYPFTLSIPFFGVDDLTLSSTGVMRCGG